ncbi:MAG: hypothetical protein RLZZ224_1956 [Verrucomicrobiota bacterium]
MGLASYCNVSRTPHLLIDGKNFAISVFAEVPNVSISDFDLGRTRKMKSE